jgi:hypothetical protein
VDFLIDAIARGPDRPHVLADGNHAASVAIGAASNFFVDAHRQGAEGQAIKPQSTGAERARLPALCLSVAHCLAAPRIRRELLDLCQHYFGPHGVAANHESARIDG